MYYIGQDYKQMSFQFFFKYWERQKFVRIHGRAYEVVGFKKNLIEHNYVGVYVCVCACVCTLACTHTHINLYLMFLLLAFVYGYSFTLKSSFHYVFGVEENNLV
jgi:hypothetical protein